MYTLLKVSQATQRRCDALLKQDNWMGATAWSTNQPSKKSTHLFTNIPGAPMSQAQHSSVPGGGGVFRQEQDRSRLSGGRQKEGLPSDRQNMIRCDSTREQRKLKYIPTYVDMYIHKVYFCFNIPTKGRERLYWGRRRVGWLGEEFLFIL